MSVEKPTLRELEVHRLALKDAEKKNNTATLIFGRYPGWFYRMAPTLDNPFDMDVDDVYLYSPDHEERVDYGSAFDLSSAWQDGKVDKDFVACVMPAFDNGARVVYVRPMNEVFP